MRMRNLLSIPLAIWKTSCQAEDCHILVANNNWYPDVSSHGNPKHHLSLLNNNNLADFRQIMTPGWERQTKMTIYDSRMKFGELAKSRPRSDIFLCSIKEGTGYGLCGALQNSESIFVLPVWFCWYHLFYITKWYKSSEITCVTLIEYNKSRVSPSQSIRNHVCHPHRV
jgi:hypothetical protein